MIYLMPEKVGIHERASLFGEAVFASDDGLITTFAVVAGSAGASFSPSVVLILGFANLFADGLSMATGKYLGVESEIDYEKVEERVMEKHGSPLKIGLVTYLAFVSAGFLPLLPYILNWGNMFLESSIIVGIALFMIGSFRSRYTHKSWLKSGLEMFFIGGFAASIAFLVGFLLDKYVV